MIVAVVPLKSLAEAKSRLRGVLSDTERRELTRRLVERTIAILRHSGRLGRIALATEERSLAQALDVEWLPDQGGLNESLAAGIAWARAAGAASVLIVPADLPLLCLGDVRALADGRPRASGIALSATQDGGTGALLLTPPGVIRPSFGPGSFARHLEQARRHGIDVRIIRRGGLCFDLDTGDDLAALAEKREKHLPCPKTAGAFPPRIS